MSDLDSNDQLVDRLNAVLTALKKIPRRFANISQPRDFLVSEEGSDQMDAICMILIAVGEACKVIDRQTEGKLFANISKNSVARCDGFKRRTCSWIL